MKQYFLTVLFLSIFTFPTFGQETEETPSPTAKGNLVIGGSIGGNYSTNDFGSDFNFSISPSAGLFVADRFLVLVSPTISINRSKFMENEAIVDLRYGLGGQLRYYTPSNIFFGAGGELGANKRQEESPRTYAFLSAFVGYAWFIRPNVAIEPAIIYSRLNTFGDREGTGTGNLSFGAGLNFYLDR